MPRKSIETFASRTSAILSQHEAIIINAIAIAAANEGRARFSMAQTAKILRVREGDVAHKLHEAGITVSHEGRTKYTTPADIATYCAANNISPIDTRWAHNKGA